MDNLLEVLRPSNRGHGHLSLARTLRKNRLVFRSPFQAPATLELTRLDPITFVLDLPGFGKIELGLERDGNTVRFCLRAPRCVDIRRGEIDEPQEMEAVIDYFPVVG